LKWRLSAGEIGRLADQGLALLLGSAERVRPGGLLIAITCSLEEEENEQVVARFRAARGDFAPLPLGDLLPAPLGEWATAAGRWQLPTGGDHDGFTVHVLSRRGPGA
jgi:16S rRNA (cytosine967-C5)-methyltransferase